MEGEAVDAHETAAVFRFLVGRDAQVDRIVGDGGEDAGRVRRIPEVLHLEEGLREAAVVRTRQVHRVGVFDPVVDDGVVVHHRAGALVRPVDEGDDFEGPPAHFAPKAA